PDPATRVQRAGCWDEDVSADLDDYVDAVLEAKTAGLPVLLGLEVDHYAGRMGEVERLLAGYPFDVLLGSVHWIGAWGFDILENPIVMSEWDNRSRESIWDGYTEARERLADSGVWEGPAHAVR